MIKTILRSTRRGWVACSFLMADTGANPGGAAGAVDPNAGAAPSAAQPIDYKALLLQLLELDPSADDAAIQTAIDAEKAEPAVDTATTKAAATSALQTQLDTANARILELETSAQQAQQDEINELIEEAGELPDDAKTALRNALTTDRAGGTALLAAMKKPAAPPTPPAESTSAAAGTAATAPPPAPKHNPKAAAAGPTDAEKITQQNELISKIRKEGKFSDYESARAEARRQKPELFS